MLSIIEFIQTNNRVEAPFLVFIAHCAFRSGGTLFDALNLVEAKCFDIKE